MAFDFPPLLTEVESNTGDDRIIMDRRYLLGRKYISAFML
jgi:hypothetical protein